MTADTKQKRRAFIRGKRAEQKAAFYLMLKGYRIMERRFKTRLGEIDIIARRGNLILIVEVKARTTEQAAHDAVGKNAEQRITAAADLWLMRQKDYAGLSLRFDLIIIRPWRMPQHIPAIFCPSGYRR